MIADPKAFIIANTRLLPVPHAPEICLYLADEVTPLWLKTEEELGEMGLPPPFWAFAWAGGQALARYILDHPNSVVGKRVLDFASGSGLVAIAAMKAGASEAHAADIDGFAQEAIGLNAAVNAVEVVPVTENVLGRFDMAADVILAAAPDGRLVSDPLEVELGIFKDRVEFALLLPSAAADAFPWRDKNDSDNP